MKERGGGMGIELGSKKRRNDIGMEIGIGIEGKGWRNGNRSRE